jgi:hypothetical protein
MEDARDTMDARPTPAERWEVDVAKEASARSHEAVSQVLRRAGYAGEFIGEVLDQLPDPVDLQRDQQILARYGLSTEQLTDRMGGSP